MFYILILLTFQRQYISLKESFFHNLLRSLKNCVKSNGLRSRGTTIVEPGGMRTELLNVSRTTVYRWRQRGLGVVRIHGVVRIGELSLQQFIARHYAQETQAVPA